ncbi:MAG: hypothetical protein EA359_05290 [Balneolaceae bacterium]|nr:MAG: hypothetical protein EA359_05290 [Balneolaceae bacterium]
MRHFLFLSVLLLSVYIFHSCGTESTQVYTLTTSVNGEGTITPAGGEFEEGETVTLTAAAAQHWMFNNWSGDGSGSSGSITISMDRDMSITGNFQRMDYPLTITIEGEGTVEQRVVSSPKSTDYTYETVVELTPVPHSDWEFVGWGDALSGSETPVQITVSGPVNVLAVFEPIHYAWVLVNTEYRNYTLPSGEWSDTPLGEYRHPHDFYSYYTWQDDRMMEFKVTSPRGRTINDPAQFLHGYYTWDAPPEVIDAGEQIKIAVDQEVLSNETGGYSARYSLNITMGHPWRMVITEPAHIAEDEYIAVGFGAPTAQFTTESVSVVFSREAWGSGSEGSQQEIRVAAGSGNATNMLYERYIYEWKQVN